MNTTATRPTLVSKLKDRKEVAERTIALNTVSIATAVRAGQPFGDLAPHNADRTVVFLAGGILQKNSVATKKIFLGEGEKYEGADTTASRRSREATPDLASLNRLPIQRLDLFVSSVFPGVPLN